MPSTAKAFVRSAGRVARFVIVLMLVAVCGVALSGAPARSAGPVDVRSERVLVDEPGLHVDVVLPRTGLEAVDARLRALADELVAQARAAELPPGTPWTREVFGEYESFRTGGGVWSFLLTYGLFTGGAHPTPVVETLVFDLSDGRQLAFADVFKDDPASVEALASYVVADLVNRQGLDADWVAGAFADPGKAMSRFVLRESGPLFVFPPYEVAPYVFGTITVPLPWAALKELVRPDFGGARAGW